MEIRTIGGRRCPLGGVDEQLADAQRGGRRVAKPTEPAELFGRQGVFEEKESVRLEPAGEVDRVSEREP